MKKKPVKKAPVKTVAAPAKKPVAAAPKKAEVKSAAPVKKAPVAVKATPAKPAKKAAPAKPSKPSKPSKPAKPAKKAKPAASKKPQPKPVSLLKDLSVPSAPAATMSPETSKVIGLFDTFKMTPARPQLPKPVPSQEPRMASVDELLGASNPLAGSPVPGWQVVQPR